MTAGDPAPPVAGHPLAGRVALVTGVSRRIGIGMAVARRRADRRAHRVLTTGTPHHPDPPGGAGPDRPWFSVALVPHTLAVTTLGRRQPGDAVQLEVDVLAKYVERLLGPLVPDREV